MKKIETVFMIVVCVLLCTSMQVFGAYHHEGENDSDKFIEVYPNKAGTKLDQCVLCHSGGSYVNSKGKEVELGSCQWCHESYGYDGSGEILGTLNAYGLAYRDNGSSVAAVEAIEEFDSDDDGYSNITEINANRYPGDGNDDPSKVMAPSRVYTRGQLEAMTQHTQFLLMNTSRSGDSYALYSGVPMKELLDDVGILETATGILVYAPDGWSQYHPLEFEDGLEMYHVYGDMPGEVYQYPPSTYFWNEEADVDENPDYGWCEYSAASCAGRSHGDDIYVANGLKAILALKHEGTDLYPGVLNDENKLDGEGPFRVVVPQTNPNAPDQSSKSDQQDVIWPYVEEWDHNAGACTKSVTIIKVEPLPEGTTDINVLEAGWEFVDGEKIIIYGSIDGTDSNGDGILDTEANADGCADYDNDGTPDYQDADTSNPRSAEGLTNVLFHTDKGAFANMEALGDDDAKLSQTGKPEDIDFPWGAFNFDITGLTPGDTVTVTIVFDEAVPVDAKLFKVTATNGWVEIPFDSNDGDETITVTLTDGDAATDADGTADGTIFDPCALGVESSGSSPASDGGSSTCFITTAGASSVCLLPFILLAAGCVGIGLRRRTG